MASYSNSITTSIQGTLLFGNTTASHTSLTGAPLTSHDRRDQTRITAQRCYCDNTSHRLSRPQLTLSTALKALQSLLLANAIRTRVEYTLIL